MKKILSCLCAVSLIAGSMGISFASSENQMVVEDMSKIDSVRALEAELKTCDTEAEAKTVLSLADDEVVTEFYQELNSKTMEIVEKIPSDVCYRDDAEIANIANSIDGIEKIDIKTYCVGSEAVTVEEVYLDDGTKVTTTFIDGAEGVQSANEMIDVGETISPRSVTGSIKQMRKDFGDRYTQINCKVEYALYPDTLLKTRIGYTVNSDKTIKGRYIKGYEDSASNIANEITNTPTDGAWIKKAANSSYVKAYQNFLGKFSIKGVRVLTYEYRVEMTAEPTKWGDGYALMKVTADITTKIK